MTQAQLPPLTKDLLAAFTAHAVAWALRLLGVLFDPRAPRRRRRLVRFVRALERFVEHILFLEAVHAFGPPPQRRTQPNSTRSGFRRSRGKLRLFWKIARIRAPRGASLVDRVAQLMHALAHPERYAARFTKELCKGLTLTHLIPCAPPAHALAADAPSVVAVEDTS
jgi:hypothetical protein